MKTGKRVSREDEDRKACFKRRMKTGRRVSRGGIRPEGVFQEEDEENPNSARARMPPCLSPLRTDVEGLWCLLCPY